MASFLKRAAAVAVLAAAFGVANAEDISVKLTGSEEVPAGFRTQIEEYFRSLARRPSAR